MSCVCVTGDSRYVYKEFDNIWKMPVSRSSSECLSMRTKSLKRLIMDLSDLLGWYSDLRVSLPQWIIRSRCLLGQRNWWAEQWNICSKRRTERKTSGEAWCCHELPSWPTGITSPMRRTRCCTCISCGMITRTETCGSCLNQVQKWESLSKSCWRLVCQMLHEVGGREQDKFT